MLLKSLPLKATASWSSLTKQQPVNFVQQLVVFKATPTGKVFFSNSKLAKSYKAITS